MHGTLHETGSGRFDWIPVSGDPVEGVENACGAPRGVELIPEWDGQRLIGYELAGIPRHDAQSDRLHLCLLYVVDSAEADTEQRRAALARMAREWEHRRRTQHPAGDYRCGYQVIVDQRQPRTLFFQPYMVRDQIQDYESWTHWGIMGGYKPGLNGEAYLNSDKLAVYGSGGDVTLDHETDHMESPGCGHSNAPGSERSDQTCKMGRAQTGLNAYHLMRKGQLGPVIEISESATVHLVPVEVEPSDLRNGEHHAAKVEHNGRKLLLSLRKTASQHYCGVTRHEPDVLFVHEPESRQWFRVRPNILDSTADEVVIDDIQIRNLGGGVVQVQIGRPAPEPQPIETLPIPAGDEPTVEHSGVWADPRYKHQGFDLTVHGDRMTGYWFGHHPRGKHGSPAMGGAHSGRRWLILHGHVRNGHVEFTAQSVINGEPRNEGQGTIRFEGDTAMLRWDTGMYGREHYRLARVTPPKINPLLLSFGDMSGISLAEYDNPKPDRSIKRETSAFYFGPGQGGQDWHVMHGQPDALTVHSVEQRHRDTHEGEVSELGTARLKGGEFEMLGHSRPVTDLLEPEKT